MTMIIDLKGSESRFLRESERILLKISFEVTRRESGNENDRDSTWRDSFPPTKEISWDVFSLGVNVCVDFCKKKEKKK